MFSLVKFHSCVTQDMFQLSSLLENIYPETNIVPHFLKTFSTVNVTWKATILSNTLYDMAASLENDTYIMNQMKPLSETVFTYYSEWLQRGFTLEPHRCKHNDNPLELQLSRRKAIISVILPQKAESLWKCQTTVPDWRQHSTRCSLD